MLIEILSVVEWDTKLHEEGLRLWVKAIVADGGKSCRDHCTLIGEPLIEGMVVGQEKDFLEIPERQQVRMLALSPPPPFLFCMCKTRTRMLIAALQLSDEKLKYEKAFLAQWNAEGIDAIVLPVLPWVNYRPKTWVKSNPWLGLTALWNLLNYTALVIPGSRADVALDQPGDEWKKHVPRNESDKFNHEQCEYMRDLCCTETRKALLMNV